MAVLKDTSSIAVAYNKYILTPSRLLVKRYFSGKQDHHAAVYNEPKYSHRMVGVKFWLGKLKKLMTNSGYSYFLCRKQAKAESRQFSICWRITLAENS